MLPLVFGAFSVSAQASASAVEGEGPALALMGVPDRARQGDPVFALLEAESPLVGVRFEIRTDKGILVAKGEGFRLPSAGEGERWGLLVGLGWEAPTGNADLRVYGSYEGKPFSIGQSIGIVERRFPTDEVNLNAANSELRVAPDPQKTAEALAIQAIYARLDPAQPSAILPFVAPVGEARRSAGFGDRRRYLYASGGSDSIWHSGIDFAVPVGTPVRAPAAGLIVFAGSRIVTGFTVVIEHAPGIYSVLMHLSKGLCQVGSTVKAGDLVAYSGVTGLATGPHLHWEVRVAGVPVDPDWFLSAKGFPWLDTQGLPMR